METPDKICVITSSVNSAYGNKWGCWTERECDGYAYIRKDALLEWAKDMKEANDGVCDTSYYQEFIDKINSM